MANSSQPYIAKDLEDLLETFQIPTSVATSVEITDVNTVASYTWATTPTPTIVVPGSPRVWINAQRRIKLSPDRGYFNADETAVRMGTHGSVLTPIFAALDQLYPPVAGNSQAPLPEKRLPFDLAAIDVVCERNALRKLYRLANFNKRDRKGWRIDVEVSGKTCLFTSIQAARTVYLKGRSGYGYGYEKASTLESEPGVEATQHHRITAFVSEQLPPRKVMLSLAKTFGSLRILLRYEVDACVLPRPLTNSAQTSRRPEPKLAQPVPSPNFPKVSIISSGDASSIVPQSSLLEIKTRTGEGEIDWREIYPQLFFSQTPNLHIARHQQGLFSGTSVTKYDLKSPELTKAAQGAGKVMAKMHELLEAIVAAARKQGEGAGMALTYDGKELALYRRKPGTGMEVGQEILSRFTC